MLNTVPLCLLRYHNLCTTSTMSTTIETTAPPSSQESASLAPLDVIVVVSTAPQCVCYRPHPDSPPWPRLLPPPTPAPTPGPRRLCYLSLQTASCQSSQFLLPKPLAAISTAPCRSSLLQGIPVVTLAFTSDLTSGLPTSCWTSFSSAPAGE